MFKTNKFRNGTTRDSIETVVDINMLQALSRPTWPLEEKHMGTLLCLLGSIELGFDYDLDYCDLDYNWETPPETPPSSDNDSPKFLRRYGHLSTKRSYEAIEDTNKGTGRSPKSPKRATNKATSKPATSKSVFNEPATGEPATDKSITNSHAINGPNTIEDLETPANNKHQQSTDETLLRSTTDAPMQLDETTIAKSMESSLPTITYSDGMAILDEFFQNTPSDSGLLIDCQDR
jgi:hypothetical protein